MVMWSCPPDESLLTKLKKKINVSYSFKSLHDLIHKWTQLNTEQKHAVYDNLIIIPHENTSHVHTHAHILASLAI